MQENKECQERIVKTLCVEPITSLVSESISYQCYWLFNIQVIQFKVTKLIGSFFRNNQNTWCIVKHASDVSCNWCNLWWESRFLGWLTTASSVSGIGFRGLFSGWNSIDAGSLSVNVRKKSKQMISKNFMLYEDGLSDYYCRNVLMCFNFN